MDYLSKKVSSFTSDTISDINEDRRKRDNSKSNKRQQQPLNGSEGNIDAPQPFITQGAKLGGFTRQYTPLANGFPFGGDSLVNSRYPPPPPIGFRTDLLSQDGKKSDLLLPASQAPLHPEQQVPKQPAQPLGGSEESLYQGDGWTRLWFQRVMLLSLCRLLLFVRKVYEDFHATKQYNLTGQTGHFLVSAAALFLPTIVFTTYRISRYLQLTLPSLRINNKNDPKQLPPPGLAGKNRAITDEAEDKKNDHDATRALMSSPGASSGQQLVGDGGASSLATQASIEDDGLVTARQSPSNLEDFQDSKSQQGIVARAMDKHKLESVDIDKLGDLPDKNTTRIVIGTSEQLLHGALFVFWQLKRQVDVMGYLVERACLWRKPREIEKEELGRLNTSSDGLEWFQDFYAAFLAILTQVYTLAVYWSSGQNDFFNTTSINTATNTLTNSPKSLGDVQLSPSAGLVSNILEQQASAKNKLERTDLLILSQLIVSSVVILSLLVAVRRRDDGPLTLGLSMIGWGSIFAARIIIIAMAFVHIGWHIMLPLVLVHIFAITCWIYKISLDSHNNKPSEREMEARWDEETAAEIELEGRNSQSTELEANSTERDTTKQANHVKLDTSEQTDQWSIMEHLVLLTQIFTLFSIPSLFYWPIMFNLKFHQRPLKYLLLILIQNFILIPTIWSMLQSPTIGQLYLLGAVGAFSIVGFIFVSLYVCCKPSLTEYFARADEMLNQAERCGIYFEFCSRVFKMPELSKQSFRRLMDQTEQIVEEQVSDADSAQ